MPYQINRFFFEGDTEQREVYLTLDEAQAHCSREDTHGEDWFDGYTRLNSTDPPECHTCARKERDGIPWCSSCESCADHHWEGCGGDVT